VTAVATKLITADELLAMGDIGRCELIYGELVKMSPTNSDHGEIAMLIGIFVGSYVLQHDLGRVYAAETGFLVERNPDLVRAPDVSFVRKDHAAKIPRKKFIPGVPDLAAEVISPSETRREVAEKVNMWLAHGTISCWVADPDTQTITIHRMAQSPLRLTVKDTITDEPTLPGFVLPVSKIFRRP
jgi:Uma2 family endonuclease